MTGIPELTEAEWVAAFRRTFGRKNSYSFVPLPSGSNEARVFEQVLAALLADDPATAGGLIAGLGADGIHYTLVRVGGYGTRPLWGWMECAMPGTRAYRGWGPALVRPGEEGHTIYQAPHPRADGWTEHIALRAFMDDEHAAVALFAGAHRYANGRDPAPADAAHTPHNLLHVLTGVLAVRGRATGRPPWFVQFHGSADRTQQPAITASSGAAEPGLDEGSPLPRIAQRVQAAGHLTIALCPGPKGARRPRRPLLCGTGNIQGNLLETLGLRHTFMHFETAQSARSAYRRGAGPGYDGIRDLLVAIRGELSRPAAVCGGSLRAPSKET
ncbi:MAG TPA: hypothetical protein VLA19_26895 [Herpetosiphonaceae bacterium]|nr:hypothetical protein [Herpetosiphonaceae bacterium]